MIQLFSEGAYLVDGTTLVKDIYPGSGDGFPNHLKNINGTLYFWARYNGGGASYELWKSDGTENGTVLIKDIYPGGSQQFWRLGL